ncbi:hypothetical protein SJAG_04815 [Schizosaccharomyces japonicus yFS275]|uniref:Uncharacterized protein n=1 Tax=Schizosaccharomyces japonicus (strain yFS275 / FY16936) TaxID=402676 RepID=B6K7U3_SCHJY|nr:hypothetical protein SJAG_04815 [Schizosaccharomyces japonicus yFS275]EEB09597.2 hypothetical protein SJAG_04815 [Schizosaccharomyces japonicus yFS275]
MMEKETQSNIDNSINPLDFTEFTDNLPIEIYRSLQFIRKYGDKYRTSGFQLEALAQEATHGPPHSIAQVKARLAEEVVNSHSLAEETESEAKRLLEDIDDAYKRLCDKITILETQQKTAEGQAQV